MSLKKIGKRLYRSLPLRMQCKLDSLRQRGVLTVGPGSLVDPSVHILGRAHIRLGANCCISEGSWLNVNHRDDDRFQIDIGTSCFVGKRNFFTSGDLIKLGDFCLTAVDVKFLGSSHVIDDPYVPHIFSGTTRSNRIVIGANCFIGAGASIVGNVIIAHGCVVGAAAVVNMDLPPFSLALGAPAKVIKRYSFTKKMWVPLANFTEEDEAAIPVENEYLKELHARFSGLLMPFIACGKRMGDI